VQNRVQNVRRDVHRPSRPVHNQHARFRGARGNRSPARAALPRPVGLDLCGASGVRRPGSIHRPIQKGFPSEAVARMAVQMLGCGGDATDLANAHPPRVRAHERQRRDPRHDPAIPPREAPPGEEPEDCRRRHPGLAGRPAPSGTKQQQVGSNLDYLLPKGWAVEQITNRTFTTPAGTTQR
jgi:hypothetical protein